MFKKFSPNRKERYHLFAFLFSKFISTLGTSIYNFGISFYVLFSTGSSLLFSFNLVAGALPIILFSLIAGHVADKYSKKKIIVGFQLVNIITMICLFSIIYFYGINIIAIYVTTAILSITSSFLRTTFTSSIPNLFSEENIQFVFGINQSTLSLAGILGPVVGGMIYGVFGVEVLLLFFIGGYSISTILDVTIDFNLYTRNEEGNNKNEESNMKDSIISGLKYSFRNKIIASLLLVAVFANFFGSAVIVGLSKVLVSHFQMEAQTVGSIESLIAFGTMAGGVLVGFKKSFKKPLNVSKKGMILIGLIISVMSTPFIFNMSNVQVVITYGFLLFLYGIFSQFANTPLFVFLQKNIDENYRGRVFSLLEMNAMLLSPLSFVVFGLLFDLELYIWIFTGSGILTIIAVLFILRPSITKVNSIEQSTEEYNEQDYPEKSNEVSLKKMIDLQVSVENLKEKVNKLQKEIDTMKSKS